jgi:dTMP kinase
MPARLIVFSGLDGAGKSTQLHLLGEQLRHRHFPYLQVWSRGGYTPGMEWCKWFVRSLTGRRVIPKAGEGRQRTEQFSRPAVRRLWLTLAIIDLMLLYVVWIRWQLIRGRYVLADRYWQDTLLDFGLNFPSEHVERWWLWRLLVRLAPRPAVAILLTIPIEESLARSQQKQEPFPTPADQLEERAAQYALWAEQPNWSWYDGLRPMKEIAASIAEQVFLSQNNTRCAGKPATPVDG